MEIQGGILYYDKRDEDRAMRLAAQFQVTVNAEFWRDFEDRIWYGQKANGAEVVG